MQVLALSALSRLPVYKLSTALLEGELGTRLLPCLQSSSKEVGYLTNTNECDVLKHLRRLCFT